MKDDEPSVPACGDDFVGRYETMTVERLLAVLRRRSRPADTPVYAQGGGITAAALVGMTRRTSPFEDTPTIVLVPDGPRILSADTLMVDQLVAVLEKTAPQIVIALANPRGQLLKIWRVTISRNRVTLCGHTK